MKIYSDTIRAIIADAVPKLLELDAEKFNFKPRPEKWSKKEILGHLIDSAYNNHQRFIRAEAQDDLIFLGYDQDAWVIKNNYQARKMEAVIELWRSSNEHICTLMEHYPVAVSSRQTSAHNFHQIGMNVVPKGVPSSLAYLMWDYVFHIEYHLAQILEGYDKRQGDFLL